MNWFKYALIKLLKCSGFDILKENKEFQDRVLYLEKENLDLKKLINEKELNEPDNTNHKNLPRYSSME